MRRAAAAVAAVAVSGCGDGGGDAARDAPVRACTQIGCRSGVGLRLAELPRDARRIRACVADRCRTATLGRDRLFLAVEGVDREREVRVRLEVFTTGERAPIVSEIDVRLRAERPNGEGCPPVCFLAYARYDALARRLYEAPGLGR